MALLLISEDREESLIVYSNLLFNQDQNEYTTATNSLKIR